MWRISTISSLLAAFLSLLSGSDASGDFEIFTNYACRTSQGDRGRNGREYILYTGVSKHKCARKCRDYHAMLGNACFGYEYNHASRRCEVWKEPIDKHRLDYKHGLNCYVREVIGTWRRHWSPPAAPAPSPLFNVDIDLHYEKFSSKVCRTPLGERGHEGSDYALFRCLSEQECGEKCYITRRVCYGFEYKPHDNRCEIWWTPISEHELDYKHGFHCYIDRDELGHGGQRCSGGCSSRDGGKGGKATKVKSAKATKAKSID